MFNLKRVQYQILVREMGTARFIDKAHHALTDESNLQSAKVEAVKRPGSSRRTTDACRRSRTDTLLHGGPPADPAPPSQCAIAMEFLSQSLCFLTTRT